MSLTDKISEKPKLFFGDNKEDREAIRYLLNSEIEFEAVGPIGGIMTHPFTTPFIEYDLKRYSFKKGIEYFIENVYPKNWK